MTIVFLWALAASMQVAATIAYYLSNGLSVTYALLQLFVVATLAVCTALVYFEYLDKKGSHQ